ncbi:MULTISPECIES: methyl-accepting chemotaxis protein [unclassified Janthinobacterium]|uniref:methyl-accepting chemotaxis protein n=1 Tax=unclassified Janthinobacterium TaxID=2610881 RepID=UPI0016152122|nr:MULTISPECIES: methyl-accepting chemotaxis protein [unclassified Janthinobacterium]MBB5368602.1 methyl-accepting chemotaxis protein [Janthinobacterium sp. K2C7]MBB5381862.1 methyl-accepting chemotaxis protein [Janthinobacterium sp. K2Li3]MBB5386984.1 methyl-accepting chemotaxis protein [Janthinobacterium sp. K2E3]
MFKNLLIKWKLATLVAVMMLALLVVAASGYTGIAKVGNAVNEIGVVRLPSIQGLLMINEGQTAVAAATLTAAIYENNYQSQDQFSQALRLRERAWADIEQGRKLYEALPQTDEEVLLWKRFQGEWATWKSDDDKVGATLNALANQHDESQQKALFVDFYKQYLASRGPFDKAEATLNEIIKLNKGVADTSVTDGAATVTRSETMMLSLALLAAALGIACAAYISGNITRPINAAVQVAQTVAAGDLTSRIEVTTTEETGQLLQALKDMNGSLVQIVGQVRSGTDTIATASSQIASGNLDLSSRTEEQASSLEETASSMEELTSTVRQNADNARQANQLARSASSVAVKGGDVVGKVVQTMNAINDSSRKIVDIISVIDGIAFQTNILALNAAVEAARAGEQGRGFAVVAGEVRNLAQRSAAAAREIKTLIGDSVEAVGEGSKLVAEAGGTMADIVTSVQRVTDIMAEITLATQEQSSGIDQINQAISQMDQVTQQNAALVEESAAAAESLQEQAGQLAGVVSVFKLDGTLPASAPAPAPVKRAPAMPVVRAAPPVKARPVLRAVPTPRKSAPAEDEWEVF